VLPGRHKKRSNSHITNSLSGKFPRFAASFPGVGSKSTHFGQNVPIAGIETEKFAAKFGDAGNLFNLNQLTSFSFGQPCSTGRLYGRAAKIATPFSILTGRRHRRLCHDRYISLTLLFLGEWIKVCVRVVNVHSLGPF
jgi:hypothetical protein